MSEREAAIALAEQLREESRFENLALKEDARAEAAAIRKAAETN